MGGPLGIYCSKNLNQWDKIDNAEKQCWGGGAQQSKRTHFTLTTSLWNTLTQHYCPSDITHGELLIWKVRARTDLRDHLVHSIS